MWEFLEIYMFYTFYTVNKRGFVTGSGEIRMNKERVVFLDWLRVIACFMVMAIHSAEPFYLGGTEPNITHIASRWDMLWITVTECLCRACVPLFVMTSSYLL